MQQIKIIINKHATRNIKKKIFQLKVRLMYKLFMVNHHNTQLKVAEKQ